MKKFFITLALTFLFFFLFLPNTYALESDFIPNLGDYIKDIEILCSSNDNSECNELGASYSYYGRSSNTWYRHISVQPVQPNGFYNSFGLEYNIFQGPQPDGKFLLSTYYDSIYNYNIDDNSGFYSYSGKKDKLYRAYFVFSADGPVQTYTQIDNIKWTFDLKYVKEDTSTTTTEDFTDNYNVGFLEFDSNYVENSKAYPYGIILFFEFRSKLDFDNFRFMMSSEDYYNIYFGNASSDKDVRMVYNEFKFVETNKLLLDEDTELSDDIKNQIDKIYDSSEAISAQDGLFDNLKQCDVTDIGCHFSNLWTVLKGIFERIGTFFLTILDTIVTFFSTMFSTKILGIDVFFDKLEELVQPSNDGITTVITAPLEYIKSLSNGVATCSSISLPLGSWFNKDLILPCPSTIYSKFGSFLTIYQTITTGIIAYWCLVNILSLTLQFKEPFSDKIEVMDL